MENGGKLIVGNWKMNGTRGEAEPLARAVVTGADGVGARIVLCPPFTLLQSVAAQVRGSPVALGGQDCHAEPKGAFTGSISAEMLADIGAGYVIVGHSERRAHAGESSAIVSAKASAALRAGLTPIICVGETLTTREAGHAETTVSRELEQSLPPGLVAQEIVIAYEPIWAIGTGRTCGAAEIVAMHDALRETLSRRDPRLAASAILYGGSVKADNAREILALHNVDGALVGGASLKAEEFLAIAIAGGAGAAKLVDTAPERVT